MTRFKVILLAAAFLSLVGTAATVPAQQQSLPQADAALYASEPQPLTLDQCGQCHPGHFRDIKQQGGKHQFDCRECHTTFHAYNPRKDNFAEIMPDCTQCHSLIHGDKHNQCLSCHSNPHAAIKAPTLAGVLNYCADCHTDQGMQLSAQPSKHTELSCDNCHHTEHGSIPFCSECHQPHFEAQAFTGCASCHPAHQPLTIPFAIDNDLRTCSGCHNDIYPKWQQTISKHGQVGCTECHTEHKKIPECSSCHGIPPAHSKTMLDKFPRCLDCHLDAHDLPTKN